MKKFLSISVGMIIVASLIYVSCSRVEKTDLIGSYPVALGVYHNQGLDFILEKISKKMIAGENVKNYANMRFITRSAIAFTKQSSFFQIVPLIHYS